MHAAKQVLNGAMVRSRLEDIQDTAYKKFHARLVPTLDPEYIIGIRVPVLRQLARELYQGYDMEPFLAELPHYYLEENTLHGLLIEQMQDYAACIAALEKWLPYVDNWGTCDTVSPKVFRRHKESLLNHIKEWLSAEHTYTVRFAVGMLMTHYLDDDFQPEYLKLVTNIRSDGYYINMMAAWYIATALAKQYSVTIAVLENKELPLWTHNKAIQKAIESRRITQEQKNYLRTLRRK